MNMLLKRCKTHLCFPELGIPPKDPFAYDNGCRSLLQERPRYFCRQCEEEKMFIRNKPLVEAWNKEQEE